MLGVSITEEDLEELQVKDVLFHSFSVSKSILSLGGAL